MMNNSSGTMTYHDLQNTLDKVVGKIGLTSTVQLLRKVVDGKSTTASKDERAKLITSYIILRCQAVFDLDDQDFYASQTREYKEGRMACYYLLKKYTDGSYARIAEQFGQKKRNVLYHCHKCEGMLSVPQFHRAFSEKYKTLENYALEFIAELNAKDFNENTTKQ